MCVWRETASEGCETRETRDLHCHVRFCLGLLCERLSLVTVFVTRLRVSKFYACRPTNSFIVRFEALFPRETPILAGGIGVARVVVGAVFAVGFGFEHCESVLLLVTRLG